MTLRVQQKKPSVRAFTGLVGLPPDEPVSIPPAPADPPKSAAALRAQRYRERQKQQDPDFSKKEAERKQTERVESEREQQLEQALKSGLFPENLVALRKKDGFFFIKDAPQGIGKLVTGGYDTEKLAEVRAEHSRADGGKSVFRAPAKSSIPDGQGPDDLMTPEHSQAYVYIAPKEIRAMRRFIQNMYNEKPMMVCLRCEEQTAPEFSFAAGFVHLQDKHPDQFEQMMVQVRSQIKHCTQDHDQLRKNYLEHRAQACNDQGCVYCSKRTKLPDRIYCACGKWLNRPVKQRSDKTQDLPNAA